MKNSISNISRGLDLEVYLTFGSDVHTEGVRLVEVARYGARFVVLKRSSYRE